MKVGSESSMESAAAPSSRSALDENDGAFAALLGGAVELEEPTQPVRRQVGADAQVEPDPQELDAVLEVDIELEMELSDVDAPDAPDALGPESEVRILSEPKRSFWERLANTPAADRKSVIDVQLFERQASRTQNEAVEAVVPGPRSAQGPRSANVPPLRGAMSDAALRTLEPSTVRAGTSKAEPAELKQALRSPALPRAEIVGTEDAKPARPAPSPPMSVSLQLATIAHDVLARAAQAVAPEAADAPPMPTVVTLRPAPTHTAGQDAFIQIEHPVLGKIRLQLVIDARNLSVRAVAASAAAAKALRESEASMREDVARHGVDLESLRVDVRRHDREKKK